MFLIPLTSSFTNHKSKLYFSKSELNRILDCYSLGVSKGSWKDYAINFGQKETSFYMFKHSLASPDCILTKKAISKKKHIIYDLKLNNKKTKFTKIDDLIIILKRKELKII